MGREERAAPANTGLMAFRYETERPDGRPNIYYPYPFWKDEDERIRYEKAAVEIPRWRHQSMPSEQYLREIVILATGLEPKPAVKNMPKIENY